MGFAVVTSRCTAAGHPDSYTVTGRRACGPQILVIAVLMKGVLHRTFTVFQWEALVLLVAGITVNQLNYCTKDGGGEAQCRVLTKLARRACADMLSM